MDKIHLRDLNQKYGFNLSDELLPFVFVNKDDKLNIIEKAYKKIESIWNSISSSQCPSGAINKYAFPRGNSNARIMVVAQNPGGHGEREYYTIWADGPNSNYLMNVIDEAGIFDEVWFTNLVPFATSDNKITDAQIYSTESLLSLQFDYIQPHVVIGLGGIVNKHVKRLFGNDVPIVELSHPAYVRRFLSGNPANREKYVESFRFAKNYVMEEENV